jgi:hypothetical protein
MQDRYSRLEKSENTKQKDSTSCSSSSSRYFITPRETFETTKRERMKLDSLQYAQEAWKNIELLAQKKEVAHLKEEQWQYSEHEGKAKDAKMREERWKGQEVPTKPSEEWEEAWDTGMEQQRHDQAIEQQRLAKQMEQQRRDQAMEQQQRRDQAMEQQQIGSAAVEQRVDGAMEEVQWEGRKVSTNLSKQRRSGRYSR